MNAPATRQYRIEHVSEFRYADSAHGSLMVLRLRPRADQGQRVLDFGLEVDPLAAPILFEDAFGNACHLFNIHRTHRETTVRSRARVETSATLPVAGDAQLDGWEGLAAAADPVRFWEFLAPSQFAYPCPALDAFIAANGIGRNAGPLSSLLELAARLHAVFRYEPGSTRVDSPIERVLETGRGVCQDYTHVMIAIARSWRIPSRYVSGYLHLEGTESEQTPAGASHSWAEFLLPEMGWVGIDPTNNSIADQRHIRIAVGRDYADAAPTRGAVFGGGESELKVQVIVDGGEGSAVAGAPRAERPNLRIAYSAPGPPRKGFDQ